MSAVCLFAFVDLAFIPAALCVYVLERVQAANSDLRAGRLYVGMYIFSQKKEKKEA